MTILSFQWDLYIAFFETISVNVCLLALVYQRVFFNGSQVPPGNRNTIILREGAMGLMNSHFFPREFNLNYFFTKLDLVWAFCQHSSRSLAWVRLPQP